MGKTWGNLYYIKNIVYHRVSPYELNPFANFWKKSFQGIKRDLRENGAFNLALVAGTYFTIVWANELNHLAARKQPGQFDNEE